MADKVKILCTNATLVPIGQIKPHPENDNKQSKFMTAKMLSSIMTDGFADPIVVRTGNEKGTFGFYQVIGGEHRLKTAKKLRMEQVPITNLGNIDDLTARKLLISLNKIRGDSDEDMLAALVKSIQTDGGETALADLAIDHDELIALLDGEGPAGESDVDDHDRGDGVDETTITPKASARDMIVLLGMVRMKGDDLAGLLGAVRAWSAALPQQGEPPWTALRDLLISVTPTKKGRKR